MIGVECGLKMAMTSLSGAGGQVRGKRKRELIIPANKELSQNPCSASWK